MAGQVCSSTTSIADHGRKIDGPDFDAALSLDVMSLARIVEVTPSPEGSANPAKRAARRQLAEREGLPHNFQKLNTIRHLLFARGSRVYQSCVPKSTGFSLYPPRQMQPLAWEALPQNGIDRFGKSRPSLRS